MVSFSCESCGDSLTKKKLFQHRSKCRDAAFTCLDCSTTFYGNDFQQHTTCISEAEKYEKSLYRGNKKQQKKQQQNGAAELSRADRSQTSPAEAKEHRSTNGHNKEQETVDKASNGKITKEASSSKSGKDSAPDALKADLEKIVKKKSKPIKLSKIIKKLSEKTSLSEKDVLAKLVVLADSEGRISLQ